MDAGADLVVGLGGFVVGAASAGIVQFLLERRRERVRAEAARRLVRVELLEGRAMVDRALETSEWWSGERGLPTATWLSYREVLAHELKPWDWTPVARAFMSFDDLNDLAGRLREQEGAGDYVPEKLLRMARDEADKATRILRPRFSTFSRLMTDVRVNP